MTALSIHGGKPEIVGTIKPFRAIGESEVRNARNVLRYLPLSGYFGGERRGGYWVCRLENEWAAAFGVKHAVAVNSATSGLMAAAFAIGLKAGDRFLCPAMTMSATAAAPMFTGAEPEFGDVDPNCFSLSMLGKTQANAVFLTHLFGLSIDEGWWTGWAHQNGLKVVIDAAQSPFATCDGVYGGTTADIGVHSLNVHKHLQCGEGGMCVTDDDDLAERLRRFMNHGEMSGGPLGLNLRMTEVCAAIACAQLQRADQIIAGRIEQAEAIIAAIGDIPGLRPPVVRDGCKHVYYTVPFLVEKNRAEFCAALRVEGVPIVEGYVAPLYRLPAFEKFARPCPVAEDLHDRRLLYFENCAHDPTPDQIKQIGSAFRKAAEAYLK